MAQQGSFLPPTDEVVLFGFAGFTGITGLVRTYTHITDPTLSSLLNVNIQEDTWHSNTYAHPKYPLLPQSIDLRRFARYSVI